MSKNLKTLFTLRRARVKKRVAYGVGSATKSDFNAARSSSKVICGGQWKLKNYAFCLIALTIQAHFVSYV
jgi:hypothetical protein